MSEIIVPGGWRERFENLAGRRRDHVIVATAVAVVVLGAIAWRSRATAPVVAPPARLPASIAPAGASPVASPAPAAVVLVHVAGAVRRPGLYELPAGARVADAIESARGPRATADLSAVNLAEPLVDGQKLDVPRRGEAPVGTPSSVPPSTTAPSPGAALVDVNVADQATLETIPGIGPVTATAIIGYREEVGGFESVEQLLEVSGIGPATLESIRPYVTV